VKSEVVIDGVEEVFPPDDVEEVIDVSEVGDELEVMLVVETTDEGVLEGIEWLQDSMMVSRME